MSGFKLIAIVPLKGCDSKFTKNLHVGEIYKFYQNYNIKLDKNKAEILNVLRPRKKNMSLYSTPDEIQISISAIVGENGSGKSSLLELFYYLVYFMGTRSKKRSRKKETIIETAATRIAYELAEINGIIRNWSFTKLTGYDRSILLSRIVNKYGIDISEKGKNKPINQFFTEKLEEQKLRIKRRMKSADEIEKDIRTMLNVAVIFETDKVYSLQLTKGKFTISSFDHGIKSTVTGLDRFDLENFFYSICINYSHHSLNSESLGEWINSLFHKNDGYQTPVVINPMRNAGNFDVNRENNLLTERLIGNITYNLFLNPTYQLLGKYRFEKFIFSPKLNTGDEPVGIRPHDYSREYFATDPIGKILNCKGFSVLKNDRITERAIGYLDKKVFRIPDQYPFLFKTKITRTNYAELVSFVNADDTHITKKIHQTIHFLRSYNKTRALRNLWKQDDFGRIVLTMDQMAMWLKSFREIFEQLEKEKEKLSPYHFSLISLPGFMNVDFEIRDIDKNKAFKLSELSSGEQQIILNLSSIIYHLNNIQSISKKPKNRIKYEYVNILLDEIELYYHPNSQRRMIDELLNSIKEVPLQSDGIKAINIVLSTHSPFILSDIPSTNILRLKDGKPQSNNKQTFGSNIHDLLADNFFMESVIGKFAEDRIIEIIDGIKSNSLTKNENDLVKIIGDSFLKTSIEQYKKDNNDKN